LPKQTNSNQRKSFQPSAKPTRPGVLSTCAANALAMVPNMLLFKADEVARNGAFGKILRPEVFPNAPCISYFIAEGALRSVSRPSPNSPNRVSKETGGVLFYPLPSKIPTQNSHATTR
jgi:hypothetical protein